MNKILVATDGSESAAEAVEFGIELAAEHEAELILVHVVPALDIVPVSGFGIGGAFPHEPSLEDHALLERAAAVAEAYGIFPTTVLLAGDTVDEIVAYADSHNVDLIVIGSRGHGAIANALLGSVSRGVLAESKRPVHGRPRRSVGSSLRQSCAGVPGSGWGSDLAGVLLAIAETRGRPTGLPLVRRSSGSRGCGRGRLQLCGLHRQRREHDLQRLRVRGIGEDVVRLHRLARAGTGASRTASGRAGRPRSAGAGAAS